MSKYNWKEQAEQEGGQQADRIPAGQHKLEVVKIVTGSKAGGAFESKGGDPQIMVVFEDSQGRQAAEMHTLSDKAGWTLARLLSRGGVDMEALEAKGIGPEDFADKAFAERHLLHLTILADVVYEKRNGKEYARIMPKKLMQREPEPAATRDDAGVIDDDESIPF